MNKLIFIIITLHLFNVIVLAQYVDDGERGKYFSKIKYTQTPLPEFKKFKHLLPSPILKTNPEYVDLYWRAWELAFQHYKKPPIGSPFVSNFIDEAFSQSIFQWDTIFMIMFARYADHIFPAIQSLDNFYCRQHENGYICREIIESDGSDYIFVDRKHTINPPLFSWAEVESYRITGDKSRFKSVLPVIEKYADWLELYRKNSNTVHGLYWQTGLGSGMDNTPRNGSGWVDMSSQIVMQYRDMAFICRELGLKDKEELYLAKSKLISESINQYMWNEEDGLYYDVDDSGNQIKYKTAAAFWPMLAGVTNTHQNEKLLDNLKDPRSFWRTVPFPSLAADENKFKAAGEYWLGAVWAPINVMIIKGLDKVGEDENYENPNFYKNPEVFNEFAKLASAKYLDAIYSVLKQTGTIWENYSSEVYARGIPSAPDFVGWSGCGPIQLLIENVLGFRPDGANNTLNFQLTRIDEHGINNLHFGDVTTSILCKERKSIREKTIIEVKSDNSYKLVVKSYNGKRIFEIKNGIQNIKIE